MTEQAANIASHIQLMSTEAIAAAVRGEVDVLQLLREQLASRGVDLQGRWVGFEAASRLARPGA